MSSVLMSPKGAITIRSASAEDAGPLRELRLEALASHPEVFAADHAATAAETIERWARLVTDYALDNKGIVCVASTENRLIGMMSLVRGHWPKTRHSGEVWGMYVRADCRGLRIAEALMDECTAWARMQGVVIMKLGVVTTNAPAIRCYERCGFKAYGTDPKVIHVNGAFYDELLMAKSI
jgi:ribosomal protein S18 acetylase RimI-like enzyme